MVLFSIIVPVYNVKPYLRQCLDSIMAQTYKDFEVIIVDDGSTDGSSDVCDEFAVDKRVVVIHKQNGGLVSARKAGIKEAKGNYVCFVDSDDYIGTDYLENFAKIIEQHNPEIVAISCTRFTGEEQRIYKNGCESGMYVGDKLDEIKSRLIYDEKIGGFNLGIILYSMWSKCFKYEIISKELSVAREDIVLGEDMMVSMPLIYNASSLFVSDYSGYYYRNNATSIVNTHRKGGFIKTIDLTNLLEKKMPKHKKQLSHYLLNLMISYIFSSALNSKTYKEFIDDIETTISVDDFNRIKPVKTTKASIKASCGLFFTKNKWWPLWWLYVKIVKR